MSVARARARARDRGLLERRLTGIWQAVGHLKGVMRGHSQGEARAASSEGFISGEHSTWTAASSKWRMHDSNGFVGRKAWLGPCYLVTELFLAIWDSIREHNANALIEVEAPL